MPYCACCRVVEALSGVRNRKEHIGNFVEAELLCLVGGDVTLVSERSVVIKLRPMGCFLILACLHGDEYTQ